MHWARSLKAYNRSHCRTWYSGASSQSGPYQDGQYDVFIYTKNLKKDHGGQPKLAVTFGKTTAIKFLSVSGVSTFSTGVIESNKINQYLKDKNFDSNNISTVSSEADIIHYQYNNLVPAYYMPRGYVHARRRVACILVQIREAPRWENIFSLLKTCYPDSVSRWLLPKYFPTATQEQVCMAHLCLIRIGGKEADIGIINIQKPSPIAA